MSSINESGAPPERKRGPLFCVLMGCGLVLLTVLLLLAGGIAWFAVTLSSGPDFERLPPRHLFKSERAETKYLAQYDRLASRWPVPSETRFVDTRFGRTFVRISGPEDAEPLLLLPSAGSPGLIWFPQAERLSKRYRIYAVDTLFDSGRSIQTRPVKTTGEVIVWMDDLLDGLKLPETFLAGYSYGGWISVRYTLARPERVRRTVLMAPPGTVMPLPPQWAVKGLSALIPLRHFMSEMTEWMFPVLCSRTDAYSQELVRELTEYGFTSLRSFRMRMVPAPDVLTDAEWKALRKPVLFLAGDREVLYPAPEAVARLRRTAPSVTAEIVPDSGHDLMFVQSAMLADRILAFLSKSD